MTAPSVKDLLSLEQFAAQRPRMHAEILSIKATRRLGLGEHLTLMFENRATVLWQVQEMLRVENIRDPGAVAAELEAYLPLLPGPSELSATLLVEYPDAVERVRMLVRLQGLSRHLRLDFDGEVRAPVLFEDGREREDGKISAVQFLRVPLSPAQLAALSDLRRGVRLVVDHPAYAAETPLPLALRGALVEDLRAA